VGASAEPVDNDPGVVIPFPVKAQPSCFTCANARFPENSEGGIFTWCTIYDEVIHSEIYAAEDCYTYDYCEEGTQVVEVDFPQMSPEETT